MKQTARCPKCEGCRIMHIKQVADAGDWSGNGDGGLSRRDGSHAVPRRVLMQRVIKTGLLGVITESFEQLGETEGYVCADCGYFEEYLRDPGSIPWDRIIDAQQHTVTAGGGGPFRSK